MLRITDGAASMIEGLVQDGELPPGAGLRIAQREDHPSLAMSLAEQAAPEDLVLIEQDARVFLAPVADVRLTGQTLDARVNELGAAFFVQP